MYTQQPLSVLLPSVKGQKSGAEGKKRVFCHSRLRVAQQNIFFSLSPTQFCLLYIQQATLAPPIPASLLLHYTNLKTFSVCVKSDFLKKREMNSCTPDHEARKKSIRKKEENKKALTAPSHPNNQHKLSLLRGDDFFHLFRAQECQNA